MALAKPQHSKNWRRKGTAWWGCGF